MVDRKYYKYLAQLFGQSMLTSLCALEQPEVLRYVVTRSGYVSSLRSRVSVGEFFDGLYRFLFENYRCEYIYKNSIANQLLLNRHTPEASALLTEFSVDSCKADVVILNGTSSVYEIKTELDSFDRLQRQLAAYRKVFDQIYVVTSESEISNLTRVTDANVGLIQLCSDNALICVREAVSNRANVHPESVFGCLRQNEYCELVLNEYGYLPQVPNTRIYSACRDLAIQLQPASIHDSMVQILKRRVPTDKAETAVGKIPYSLRLLYLVRKFTKQQHCNLLTVLNHQLKIS
jgi:hypothetical protein